MIRLVYVAVFLSIFTQTNAEIRYIMTTDIGISTGILQKSIIYKKDEKEKLNGSISSSEIVQFLTEQADNGSTLLFYSYSFLGNVEPYLTQSLDRIQKRMIRHPETGIDATLIVLFRPIYAKSFRGNHLKAYMDGQKLGPVLQEILFQVSKRSHLKPKIKILAHSMGTRFLEGILESWTESSPAIDKLILAAPDIAQDIPSKWANNLPIKKITLYTNSADLFLGVSKSLLNSNRAGKLPGNKDFYSTNSRITVIQVRNVAKFPRSIDVTGHVYFLYSKKVRKDIQREIHDIEGSSTRKAHPEGYLTLI
jgi:hypothetical protein